MPRFSTTKDTLIEINNMSLQAGTRYRESGLVPWPKAEVNLRILNVGFGGVVYHGVTESEFEYNGWGGESA